MVDPDGALDFISPILDRSELHEGAERAGLDPVEAVLRPEGQPEATEDDPCSNAVAILSSRPRWETSEAVPPMT
jgi:hypothetical protein